MASYDIGTRCWFADEKEGWIGAEVKLKKEEGDSVLLEFELENEKVASLKVPKSALNLDNQVASSAVNSDEATLPPLRNPPILESPEDLTSLSYLNEPSVLHAIRMRYSQLGIYTYSGIVLIATNPFQRVDNLYSPDIIQAYAGRKLGELEPHLFGIAEDAYRCMIRDGKNQTIVVSGESGAGKTVSAKYIMRYFATVEDPERPKRHNKSITNGTPTIGSKASFSKTEEAILATNPIMEAFGNAKTTRNDNSSRFGKYLEIMFDDNVDIIGARIRTYLLERSRLVFQPATERNYHIFYQLLAGANEQERSKYKLTSINDFHYVNQGGDPIIQHINDAEEFLVTREALSTVGIDYEQQQQIIALLSAILHIGNIQITASRNTCSLALDEPNLVTACEILGISPEEFAKWTTKKQIVTRSEKIVSNLNQKQATVVRDSVAKFIYSILFDWLVNTMNKSLAVDDTPVKSFIGVLDIYGFEHFKHNSFEQFCINYANEKLQQEFNQHVFKLEQDEYINEGLEWKFIDFYDNQPCIDLIEAKLGILSLLDEESRLPSGSDESWINKLYQNFDTPKHNKFFHKPRFGKSSFTISHYAMDVTYDSEGFIEKNRDTVPDQHLEILSNSSNEFLKLLISASFENSDENNYNTNTNTNAKQLAGTTRKVNSGSIRKPTLGGIFKRSLIDLMNTINSTNVHYIRCIKPNEEKTSWKFNGPLVLSQLRACGVLETIRISCVGFPTRWPFEEFVSRYYMLVNSSTWSLPIRELVATILSKTISSADKYQIGHTKIFFRAGMLAHLEELRSRALDHYATIIQKNLKRNYYRNLYLRIRESLVAVQARIKGYLARKNYEDLRRYRAAVSIQRVWRGHVAHNEFKATRSATVSFQAYLRGYISRKTLLEKRYTDASKLIQRNFRGYVVRRDYLNRKRKIIIVQSAIRRHFARKQLISLKTEARSVSHFKEVSYRLENKVVELTQYLADKSNENKKLSHQVLSLNATIAKLEASNAELTTDNDSLDSKLQALRIEHNENLATWESTKQAYENKLKDAAANFTEIETQLAAAKEQLAKFDVDRNEYESNKKTLTDKSANYVSEIDALKKEIDALKAEAVASATAAAASGFGPIGLGVSNNVMTPLRNPGAGGQSNIGLVSLSTAKRNNLHSSPAGNEANNGTNNADGSSNVQSSPPNRNGFSTRTDSLSSPKIPGLPSPTAANYSPDDEAAYVLEDENGLYQEVLNTIIKGALIPQITSSTEKPNSKEVLYPAHVINLVTAEMWRLGFVKESERFLGLVMDGIQSAVMGNEGEDIVSPGAFWLSNVHEMLSFVNLTELNVLHSQATVGNLSEWEYQEYDRLIALVRQDLGNLEFNIYHTWMKELKKLLFKMIIPAVIESQSLPGFKTVENSRFFAKILNTSNTPQYSMDDLLNLLNKVYKALTSFGLEASFIRQALLQLLQLIGVTAFNDLLLRRNFLSWKRGLQINYNITRIEEWCKAHDIPEGILKLEHLMQTTKLLQLKKATISDMEVIYDICWTLTPSQIQRLLNQYHVADYEPPINSELLKAVASRAIADGDDTLLLETTPLDDTGFFEVPEPRELQFLETFVPSSIKVPRIKRLGELYLQSAE